MEKSAYIENGTIFLLSSEKPIEKLTVIVDGESDTLLSYGDLEKVKSSFEAINGIHQKFAEAGYSDPYGCICMVYAFNMPVEKQCYMLRRCIEYTASGFCKKIYEHTQAGDLEAWLDTEMTRLPLDVYGK